MKKLNILIKNSKKITPLGEKRVVKSKVIGWDTKHVYLNIGVKKESSVLKKEFTAFNKKLSVGLFVNILVDKVNFKLSNHKVSFIKAQFILNWAFINLKYNEGDIIKGKIIDCTKGGFTTNVGVFSFLPLSQINLQVPKNTSSFLNKCFFFKILKINYEKKNLILSRREIIEQERTDKKKKLLKNVSVGNVC
jgi:small subunit ribosomal protein S1